MQKNLGSTLSIGKIYNLIEESTNEHIIICKPSVIGKSFLGDLIMKEREEEKNNLLEFQDRLEKFDPSVVFGYIEELEKSVWRDPSIKKPKEFLESLQLKVMKGL